MHTTRCRQFPSIVNCATIDWYDPWPDDALIAVAEYCYKEAPKELGIDKMISQVSNMSCTIHSSSHKFSTDFFVNLQSNKGINKGFGVQLKIENCWLFESGQQLLTPD